MFCVLKTKPRHVIILVQLIVQSLQQSQTDQQFLVYEISALETLARAMCNERGQFVRHCAGKSRGSKRRSCHGSHGNDSISGHILTNFLRGSEVMFGSVGGSIDPWSKRSCLVMFGI
uniref:Uncharacterized protein n=1 Tax=Cacopsylla melanoneura TaxID=428564 RepID=A0A8D8QG33_9HEMI